MFWYNPEDEYIDELIKIKKVTLYPFESITASGIIKFFAERT